MKAYEQLSRRVTGSSPNLAEIVLLRFGKRAIEIFRRLAPMMHVRQMRASVAGYNFSTYSFVSSPLFPLTRHPA